MNPTIFLGSKIDNMDDEEVPPFYMSLNVHDMVLHNSMLDSGASHNLMPKGVVESWGYRLLLDLYLVYKIMIFFYGKKNVENTNKKVVFFLFFLQN